MEEIRLSIIVPVYNAQLYLEECIDSLEKQTVLKRQIILVDDGSTDASGEICDQLQKKYNDVQVIHTENGGSAKARNVGLSVAKGTYLGFVDSDDYIAPNMYELMIQMLEKYDADIACCNWYRHFDEPGKQYRLEEDVHCKIKEEQSFETQACMKRLFLNEGMTYSPCDKVYKRCLFDGVFFPEDAMYAEDIPCIYQVLKRAKRVVHTGETLYFYRVSTGSKTQSKFQKGQMLSFHFLREIENDVVNRFPLLEQEITFAVVQTATDLYEQIIKTNQKKEFAGERQEIEQCLRQNLSKIISNTYLLSNVKLVVISIIGRFYKLLMLIRRVYGQRN